MACTNGTQPANGNRHVTDQRRDLGRRPLLGGIWIKRVSGITGKAARHGTAHKR